MYGALLTLLYFVCLKKFPMTLFIKTVWLWTLKEALFGSHDIMRSNPFLSQVWSISWSFQGNGMYRLARKPRSSSNNLVVVSFKANSIVDVDDSVYFQNCVRSIILVFFLPFDVLSSAAWNDGRLWRIHFKSTQRHLVLFLVFFRIGPIFQSHNHYFITASWITIDLIGTYEDEKYRVLILENPITCLGIFGDLQIRSEHPNEREASVQVNVTFHFDDQGC